MARRKMAKLVTVHGIDGTGDTVTAAKADAAAKLEALVERVKAGPAVFHVHGLVAIVWPHEHGWSTRVDDPKCPPAHNGAMWSACSRTGTRLTVILSALSHAGQNAWNHDVADDSAFVTETFRQSGYLHGEAELARQSNERELLRWIRFQREYKRLRGLGATDVEAHSTACRTSWEPRKEAA